MSAAGESALAFRAYESAHDASDSEFIDRVRQMAGEDDFVVSEKVAGRNFSFTLDAHTDGYVTVRPGRRDGFLESGDSFHGWKLIAASYADPMCHLFSSIRNAEPGRVVRVIVYGELCGGIWHDVKTSSTVDSGRAPQKHIHYSPDVDFIAFDVHVTTEEGGRFLTTEHMQRLCQAAGILYVPTLFRGSFADVMNWCAEHLSDRTRIPDMHVENYFDARVTRRGDHEAEFSMVGDLFACPAVGARVVFEHDGRMFTFRVVSVSGSSFIARGDGSIPRRFKAEVTSFLVAGQPTPGADFWSCAGFVIRHAGERCVDESDRLLITYKNPACSESSGDGLTPLESGLQALLTNERIIRVFSRLSVSQRGNMTVLLDHLVADVWDEYIRDHMTVESDKLSQAFMVNLTDRVMDLTRPQTFCIRRPVSVETCCQSC